MRLSDLPNKMLCVDFPNKTIETAFQLPDSGYHSVAIPSWEVERALDGRITWDDLFLTLRMRSNREQTYVGPPPLSRYGLHPLAKECQ